MIDSLKELPAAPVAVVEEKEVVAANAKKPKAAAKKATGEKSKAKTKAN